MRGEDSLTANNAIMTTTIAFPRLERVTAESIRIFLREYESYVRELASRASQVVGARISTEAVRPVALKYCVDQEYLEGLLSLGFISTATTYNDLDDEDLLDYLEKKAVSA